jgi:hypothetical protein
MATWKRAYPSAKVAALNKKLRIGFRTKLSDKDIADTLQRSTSFKNFAQNLMEMYAIQADLDDLVALITKELG